MKLIVIRGPSGSGKSSTADILRSRLNGPTALVGQDYFRRTVLKEKDIPNGKNQALIKEVVLFALKNGYDVILEGIFDAGRYENMFEEIVREHPNDNHFFYLDVSFDETLRRHDTKSGDIDFGENEMKAWYKGGDRLKNHKEMIIPETDSQEAIVEKILLKMS